MIFAVLFVLGTALLAYVSRRSLLLPRSHGFPRFFAWECILLLVLLDFPYWTQDLVSVHQALSWLFLVTSIFLVIHGVRLLQAIGKPDPKRPDDELLAFEKTTRLVTVGAYRYIRHPLYSSLLFLAWGVFLKHLSWEGFALVTIASICLWLTARRDEAECLQHFGDEYRVYMRGTRMFIPFLL